MRNFLIRFFMNYSMTMVDDMDEEAPKKENSLQLLLAKKTLNRKHVD